MQNKHRTKTIIYSSLGAALEWYEFSIFMYVLPVISVVFFPHSNEWVALLASFGLFAAGYFMRPLGGFFFGNYGDRWGRKKVLRLSTGLMMLPMLGTAILPTFHTWGITSVVLLLLFRMIQGLSVGGEYTSVVTMLMEQAPLDYRARIGSLALINSSMGILLSSFTIMLLMHFLSHHDMYSFGWRIPFAIGFILAGGGFLLQLKLKESPLFKQAKVQQKIVRNPFISAIKHHPKQIFYVFIFTSCLGIPDYLTQAFVPNYLMSIVNFNHTHVIEAMCFSKFISLPFIYFSAYMTDKIGRKPVFLSFLIFLLIFTYPAYELINSKSILYAMIGNTMMTIGYAAASAALIIFINEMFPTHERISGISTGYNLGYGIFGGSAPLIATYLIQHTHNAFMPAWYIIFASLTAIVTVYHIPETYRSEKAKLMTTLPLKTQKI